MQVCFMRFDLIFTIINVHFFFVNRFSTNGCFLNTTLYFSLYLSLPLYLSCWPARDMVRSTTILQDDRSLAAVSHPCRHPISDSLASPDPAIEFAVLPCASCRTGGHYRSPSWWGMSPASSWHAPAIVSCQPSPPSGCSVRLTAQ